MLGDMEGEHMQDSGMLNKAGDMNTNFFKNKAEKELLEGKQRQNFGRFNYSYAVNCKEKAGEVEEFEKVGNIEKKIREGRKLPDKQRQDFGMLNYNAKVEKGLNKAGV